VPSPLLPPSMWAWGRIGVVSAIATVIALGWHVSTSEREKREWREAEEREARAVAVYRLDELDAWRRYVDRQIQRNLTPDGLVRIGDFGRTAYVVPSPFQVDCPTNFGLPMIDVTFGGLAEEPPRLCIVGRCKNPDDRPELSVHRHSIAAEKMMDELCVHVARRMTEIADRWRTR
jgi:hypothetical protein